MFSPDQEEAFKNMKNKSAGHGNLETKFQWVFDALFPDHHDRLNIWPFYDFTCFTHKLPMPVTGEERVKWSGGIRRDQSAAMSPSDRDDEHSSPHQGADTADDLTIIAGHASMNPNTSPTTIGSQNAFDHTHDSQDSYSSFANPLRPGLNMLDTGHGYRAASFDSTVPALTMSTRSVPDQPIPPSTPLNETSVTSHVPSMKEQSTTQHMPASHYMPELNIHTTMSTAGPSFSDFTMPDQSQSTALFYQALGGAAFNAQSGMTMQQGFNPQSLQRTPATLDPLYHQKLALGPFFEQEYNPFFHGPLVPDTSGDLNLDHLQQNPEDSNANPRWDHPQ